MNQDVACNDILVHDILVQAGEHSLGTATPAGGRLHTLSHAGGEWPAIHTRHLHEGAGERC